MNLGREDEHKEFKKSVGELKEGIISICSMLNKHGYGTLYFGVNDKGEITGQEIGEVTLRKVANEIKRQIYPSIIPTISKEVENDLTYIKVTFEGNNRPYKANGRYYIRVSDEDQEMPDTKIAEMVLERNNMDVITLIKSSRQDLTFNQLKNLYISKNITINQEYFEKNLYLYTPEGEYNLMAYILSDNNDLSIKVVKFDGNDKIHMGKLNEYGSKCLLVSINQVLSYIESINETRVDITPSGRIENKMFNMDSFKEAWLNACQHNRWNDTVPPAVYVYNNRIEIVSFGGLPRGLSLEQFYRGESKPVNEKLQKILGQLRYIEQTGHGVPLIVSNYGKKAFNIEGNFLTVTIPFNWELKTIEIKSRFEDLNEMENKLYLLLVEENDITIGNIKNRMNISESYIKRILSELKQKGYIERIGSKRIGYWKCLKDVDNKVAKK